MIYLDNNATTIMPAAVIDEMTRWCNRGNPSSAYATAQAARKMMGDFRVYLGKLCGVDTCCPEDRDTGAPAPNAEARADAGKYKVLWTSGASEANCTLFHGVVSAYTHARGQIPHIVISAIEHKSLHSMAQDYEERGLAEVTYVQPAVSGHIPPDAVAAAMRPNTALVCVMHANNETGAINDVRRIGEIAHGRGIPFHCDAVQTFGKFPPQLVRDNIDSISVSFHKFGGPPGVGALVIKQRLLIGYKFPPTIYGSQNEGYRGGTENLPGIGAAFCATRLTMTDRQAKNAAILALKKRLIGRLSAALPVRLYGDYVAGPAKPPVTRKGPSHGPEVILLSSLNHYMPNTILLSVVRRGGGAKLCNQKIKTALEKRGIVVSVGSACNTASPKASHVLYAMGADDRIRAGALRVSLGDSSTAADVDAFVTEFLRAVNAQL